MKVFKRFSALLLALLMVLSLCACGAETGKLNQTITDGDISLTVTSAEFSDDNDKRVVCSVSYTVDNNTGEKISFIGASSTTALNYDGEKSEPKDTLSWYSVEAYSTVDGFTSFYLPKEAETSDKPIYLEMKMEGANFKVQIR